jgi:hypothetical protein
MNMPTRRKLSIPAVQRIAEQWDESGAQNLLTYFCPDCEEILDLKDRVQAHEMDPSHLFIFIAQADLYECSGCKKRFTLFQALTVPLEKSSPGK